LQQKPATASMFSKGKFAGAKDDYFCYRCGESGHIATKCQATPNSEQVIQKLIRSLRQAKKEKYETDDNNRKVHNQGYFSKKSQIDISECSSLPRGLVGPASTVGVKINGVECQALLDTGSQVTIVFDDWFSKNLPDVPIHPLTGLSIWGLSSSSYPYKGYIVVDVTFPVVVAGVEESLSILALVCPDPQGPPQVPVIIGTNASFFKRLATLSQDGVARALKIQTCHMAVPPPQIKEAERLVDEPEGKVRWIGPGDCVVPPRGGVQVVCQVETEKPLKTEIFVVDTAEEDSLPSGMFITPVVLPSSAVHGKNIQVLVHNETSKDIYIPTGTVVAHVYPTDTLAVPSGDFNRSETLDPTLFDFGESSIPKTWEVRLRQKLSSRGDVFSTGEWDVGLAHGVEHHIRLTDTRPFRERSRRIAPADIDDVRRHIKELLAAGIIKESRSPYASPIVIARKKSGAIRMCVDYRTLNARTIPDQYTTPRIDDALDCLAGSKWFSVLDLRSGYYQIAMANDDKEKTAFICPLGFFQFERMPQGITGAPATFQRLMEKAVGDMHLLQVIVYLDDIIVFGRTLEEHEERLLKVLDRLRECGLKVSIDKCQFCQTQVRYVGHIVSADGVSPDPAKIEAVTRWKMPTDLKSLRSFLGFCGFYRRFIKQYSSIVRPLTELTKGYPPTSGQNRKAEGVQKYYKESEPFGKRWGDHCTDAFHKIIHCLTHAPVLAFADPAQPYVLHVDASLNGLGAVLNQKHPNGLRPVAFASRKLSASEQRYPVHQLEFLALKWAVVDKFHDYLYGAQFVVKTDNNPLTYVLSTAKLNATGHRWLAALSTYNFSLQYKPGSSNIDADVLSRYPCVSGHLGIERTTELLKDRFYWPKMSAYIEQYIKSCGRCIARKTLPKKVAPLHHMTSSGPFDLVCIDFLSIEPDSKGMSNVLVITDHFTRYAQAFVTRDQKALTVAKILCDKFFVHYGLPSRIHSDQGRDFESGLIKELMIMLGIRKSRTSPYHPQGDPQPERFNRTLLSMLGTLDHAEKNRWSQHVNRLVHAYNCTKNEATGHSPYYLLFGREARLPVDLCFGTSPDGVGASNHRQYVKKMKSDLQKAYQLATKTAQKSQQRNKRAYDRHVKHQTLAVGDRVLIRNLAIPGKHKLADKWNSVPYMVVEKLKDVPVYRLTPEFGMGGVRTLHRDHLLPIGENVRLYVPEETKKVSTPAEMRTEVVERKTRRGVRGKIVTLAGRELQNDSESEDDLIYYHPTRVEEKPRSEFEAQDGSAMGGETVYCQGGLDGSTAEMAETSLTEERHGELLDQSSVEIGGPDLEGEDP
ncbi:hypothetical protein C0J50_12903, partial [Silurus asotus]